MRIKIKAGKAEQQMMLNRRRIETRVKPLRRIDIDEEHQYKHVWPNGTIKIGG